MKLSQVNVCRFQQIWETIFVKGEGGKKKKKDMERYVIVRKKIYTFYSSSTFTNMHSLCNFLFPEAIIIPRCF